MAGLSVDFSALYRGEVPALHACAAEGEAGDLERSFLGDGTLIGGLGISRWLPLHGPRGRTQLGVYAADPADFAHVVQRLNHALPPNGFIAKAAISSCSPQPRRGLAGTEESAAGIMTCGSDELQGRKPGSAASLGAVILADSGHDTIGLHLPRDESVPAALDKVRRRPVDRRAPCCIARPTPVIAAVDEFLRCSLRQADFLDVQDAA